VIVVVIPQVFCQADLQVSSVHRQFRVVAPHPSRQPNISLLQKSLPKNRRQRCPHTPPELAPPGKSAGRPGAIRGAIGGT